MMTSAPTVTVRPSIDHVPTVPEPFVGPLAGCRVSARPAKVLGIAIATVENDASSDAASAGSPSADEARAALVAFLASASLESAPRLRHFMKYIADLTLAGQGGKINEYLIGREVFERGEDYSPSDDGVVRRQAHALRQKLLKYHAEEGAGAAVRIELPLGGYVPTFRHIEATRSIQPAPAEVPLPASPVASPPDRRRLLALGGTVVFAAGVLVGRRTASVTPAIAPEVAAIWGPWLKEGAVSICLSNPRTAIVSVYPPPSKADPGELTILPGTDTHRSFERTFQVPADAALRLVPDPSHGKLLESYAAVRLTSLLVGLGATTRVTQSRLLSWEDLRRENVIVLGHEENNRWVAPLLERMPFRITPPAGGNPRMIVGSGPSGAVSFRNSFADDPDRATEQFALISMLPGAADARRVALISGLHSQATDMAAEFLATRETLRELVGRLEGAVRSLGSQAAPWSFQAVLRTEVRDRVPMRGKIVDLRLIEAR